MSQTKSFDDTIAKLLEENPKVDESKDSIPPKKEYKKPDWADKKDTETEIYDYSDDMELDDKEW